MRNTEDIIKKSRERILQLGTIAEAYVARAISTLTIRAVLFNEILEWGTHGPSSEKSELFFDGSPHHASATYAILEQMGFVDSAELEKHFGTDTFPSVQPGNIIASSYNAGSLGTSLTKATAAARILREKESTQKVYALEGNSSMQEGSTQEALGFIKEQNLRNIVLIVNDNGHGLDGPMQSSFARTLKSYGIRVLAENADGHDSKTVRNLLTKARDAKGAVAVIFKTYLMNDSSYELPIKKDKYIGGAIARIATRHSFQAFTADTANSTGLAVLKTEAPERILDFGCREQLMVDSIEMYVRAGIPVVAGTFARYLLERAREQVSGLIDLYAEGNMRVPTVLLATHNGISHAHNGKSHFYLTGYEFLKHPHVHLYHVADAVQLEAVMDMALSRPEISIILAEREDGSPALFDTYPYKEDAVVPITTFNPREHRLLIANGHLLHAAKNVAEKLPDVELLSIPHLGALSGEALPEFLRNAEKVYVLEESDRPFLGDQVRLVAHKHGIQTPIKSMYVTDTGFDTYDRLLARNGLDAEGIKSRI